MSVAWTCRRCGKAVRQSSDGERSWLCDDHEVVPPMHPPIPPSPDMIRRVARESQVPLWLSWPVPDEWVISGIRVVAGEGQGAVACVLALSGPDPLPEAGDQNGADLLLVSEQVGVGLGARLAWLEDLDAGRVLGRFADHEPAHFKIDAAGHDTPLWSVPVHDGVGFAGEALGVWLWVLAWPAFAGAVLLDRFSLLDLRDPGHDLDLPCGAVSTRLG